MSTYGARVYRDGKWWMVSVPQIDRLTQARRLADVDQMARELIGVTLGVPSSEVAVTITYDDIEGTPVADVLATIRAEKAEAARLESDVAARTGRLVTELVGKGIPLRDIGELLGVSFQRAHQLANKA